MSNCLNSIDIKTYHSLNVTVESWSCYSRTILRCEVWCHLGKCGKNFGDKGFVEHPVNIGGN